VSVILIHHDYSKSELPRELFADDSNVEFVNEWVHGEWGGFSLVQLVLNGIDQLFDRERDFDWVTFMSGQDYPTRSLFEFEESLASVGDGAINYSDDRPLSLERYRFAYYRIPRTFESRFTHRAFFVLRILSGFQPFLRFTTGRIGCRIGIRVRRRVLSEGLAFRKGYQWWTLSRSVLQYVRTFVRSRPEIVAWFRARVLVPDESFFQTILSGANFSFISDDGHYARWNHADALSPEILRSSDLAAILESKKYFGRKFDIAVDSEVLDLLDERTVDKSRGESQSN